MGKQNRIYIIPTRFGFYFLLSVLILFIISLTYAHPLALISTFFFLSLIIISAVFTHFNIKDVELNKCIIHPLILNEIKFSISNHSKSKKYDIKITMGKDKKFFSNITDIDVRENKYIMCKYNLARGKYKLNRVYINTTYPFGIFYAWKFYNVDKSFYVYPKERGNISLPTLIDDDYYREKDSGNVSSKIGNEDFIGHRNYQRGDSWHLVDWKAYARYDQLLYKIFSNYSFDAKVELSYDKLSFLDRESRLQQLSKWLFYAHLKGLSFKLIMPNQDHAKWGRGENFLIYNLKKLAEFEVEWKNL